MTRTLIAPVATSLFLCAWHAGMAFNAEAQSSSDWPQWRGSHRDGTAVNSPKLLDSWPKEGPPLLWKSAWIPACEEGGTGSPVVADGRLFLYANAKQPVGGGNTYRLITTDILTDAGWHPDLADGLAKKIEDAWASEVRPGGAGWPWWDPERTKKEGELEAILAKNPDLDKYIKDFMATLNSEEARKYGAYIRKRLCTAKKGGLTWEQLAKLSKLRDTGLPTLRQWQKEVEKLGIHNDSLTRNAWVRAFTMSDTVVCLDAATGKELWRKDFPQDMTLLERYKKTQWWSFGGKTANIATYGIGACGTPAVWGGKCYVVGAAGLYCLSVKDGALLWKVEGEPAHASVLVASGVVYNGANGTAYHAETGKLLWKNPLWSDPWRQNDTGKYSSPLLWTSGGRNYVITTDGLGTEGATGISTVCCLDIVTGKLLWTFKGGLRTLPTIRGDILISAPSRGGFRTKAYKLTPAGAELLWDRPFNDGDGDIIHQGHLYVAGSTINCVDLKTGEFNWRHPVSDGAGDYSPLVLADGKLLILIGGCHQLTKNYGDLTYSLAMIKATPEKYTQLGLFNPRACMMSAPALAGGRMYLRLLDGVACYDLQEHGAYLDGVTASKDALSFQFKQTGGGLVAKAAADGILIAEASGAAKPAKVRIDGDRIELDIKDVPVPFSVSYAGAGAITGKNGLPVPPFAWNASRLLKLRKCFDHTLLLASDSALEQNGAWNTAATYAVAGTTVTRVDLDPQGKRVTLTTDKIWKPGDTVTLTYACFPVDRGEARRETLTFTVVETQRAAARFVKSDATTAGNWKGAYGAEGAMLAGDKAAAAPPKFALVTFTNKEESIQWASNAAEARYLQKSGEAKDRSVVLWSSPEQFEIDVSFMDGKEHQVALYCCMRGTEELLVEVIDADTKAVLNTQTVKKLDKGKYLVWILKGSVTLRVLNLTGGEGTVAAASGLFFDAPAQGSK